MVVRPLFRAALLLVVSAAAATAQQLTGSIEGSVIDAGGAAIPDASISALHDETNTLYEAATGATGQFRIPNARLGTYTVRTEADGFKRSVATGVLVEVGGTAGLRISLELGELCFEVTVTAEDVQTIINTLDAELSTTVDNRRVLELPLNGRNAAELAMLQAGVYYERAPDGQGDKFFIHGQRHRSIQISLDGIDTQDNYIKASSIMINQPLLALAAENVPEFKVVTGIASAEYSRSGASISAVTRSGGNEFHGSLFAFNRNDVFSANDFSNNSSGVGTPRLNRNQFGGRIGGPIRRNRTFFYLGYQQTRQVRGVSVNRTVYTAPAREGIFRYLDRLQNTPANVAANPGAVHSVDLLGCGPSIVAALDRDCVDERFSAADPTSLDPFITGTVFGVMPLPNNVDAGDGLNTGGFRFNAKSSLVEHLPSARFDHRFGDRHSFYATANYVDRGIEGDFINNRLPVYPDLETIGSRVTHSKGFSAALTSTFRPTLVNEARFGFLGGENAFLINQPFETPFTLDLNTIRDPYDWDDNDDVRDNRTLHLRNVTSWIRGKHQLKFGVEWRQRFVDRYDFDRINAFGAIGFDDNDTPDAFSSRDLNSLSGATRMNSANAETARDLINNLTGFVGEVFSNYNVSSLDSGFVPLFPERRSFKNHELDWFVNDRWYVRPNLTLNVGLRWEYATVPYEVNGLALAPEGGLDAVFGVSGRSGFFNPGTFAGTGCGSLNGLPRAKTTANAVGLIRDCATRYVPATSTNGRPLWNDDLNNFAPVVSIAWDPLGDGKTSVRSGFRISYIQDHFSLVGLNIDDNEGLEVRQSCVTSDGECLSNPRLLRDVLNGGSPPLPPTPAFQLPAVRSILDSSTIDFRTYDQNLATDYYAEWTLGISREIFENWALEVRYIGNRGIKLKRTANYNEINVDAQDPVTGQTFRDAFVKAQHNLGCNRSGGGGNTFLDSTGLDCIHPNPLMAALVANDAGRLGARTGLRTALERNETGQFVHRLTQVETSRPGSRQGRIRGGSFWGQVLDGRFPANFFQVNPFVADARVLVNDSSSNYNALEVELRRRFAAGFSFQSSYTFGRAIADFDGDENSLLNAVRPSSVRFPRSTRGEFAPRHLFKTNWIYELPFGTGKPFLNKKGAAGRIFGGWQFGGIVNGRGGRPLTFISRVGTFHRSAGSILNTVNLAQNLDAGELRDLTGRRDVGGGVFWIDPCTSAFLGGACSGGSPEGLLQLPEPGELGHLGTGILFGPRRFLFDFSLAKRTPLGERANLEFRWEVFNAFNNVNFQTPQFDVTNSNFGQITQTVSEPRVMQFALKVNF